MSAENILSSWKNKKFRPVYWLEGEEEFYIDSIMQVAEHQLLQPAETAFNLTVFYGKDANWADIINSCRRYPMLSEFQVVLLKEAQHMKDVDKLESYVESPLSSTVLVIGYKGKSYDKRTKFYKTLGKHAEIFQSSKLKDEQVPAWIQDQAKSRGLRLQPKALTLLHEHIGNDLSRIAGEFDKLSLNLGEKKEIDDSDIEKYVGISKEYNIFELQGALAAKDLPKAIRILNYFEANPKAVPIQAALPALYSFIGKVYSAYGMPNNSDAALKPVFYFNPTALSQARSMMNNYGFNGIEKMILLMHEFNLRAIGVGDSGTSGAALMKEMVAKMMMAEN